MLLWQQLLWGEQKALKLHITAAFSCALKKELITEEVCRDSVNVYQRQKVNNTVDLPMILLGEVFTDQRRAESQALNQHSKWELENLKENICNPENKDHYWTSEAEHIWWHIWKKNTLNAQAIKIWNRIKTLGRNWWMEFKADSDKKSRSFSNTSLKKNHLWKKVGRWFAKHFISTRQGEWPD